MHGSQAVTVYYSGCPWYKAVTESNNNIGPGKDFSKAFY